MSAGEIITQVVERLKNITGIEALVLGGSRARGTHTASSDIDLGLYYWPGAPIDLAALEQAALELDDEHRPNLVTGFGGWGPWINGGGWLQVQHVPVDFLYRDLDKVSQVIEGCCCGQFEMVYQPGHPNGFPSYIYLSEMALCQPLWDPHGTLAGLKEKVLPYPAALKQAVISRFWWEADFSLKVGLKSKSRGDVAYAAGCCFRSVMCLTQSLFALNEQYWMNEKGAVALADGFKLAPTGLKLRVDRAFEQLNNSTEGISAGIGTLQELVDECGKLLEIN